MVQERRKPSGGRASVERVAAALEVVAMRGWISAADLAAELSVDRSTGWRLARSLERVGWLHQDPATHRYRLGLPLFSSGLGSSTRSMSATRHGES